MNQKANPAPQPRRGRPPGFDMDTVIDGAVDLFWAEGFEATSLNQIRERLGVRQSTLYNSFGGKDGLYHSAVENYLTTTDEHMFAPLRGGNAGLDDLLSFVERHRTSLTRSDHPAGCLLINAMVTGENPEAIERYKNLFHDSVGAALERASTLGEIDPTAAPMLATALFGAVLGANVAAKSGASQRELNEICDVLRHTVATWKTIRPD